jgi:hypothetical protein
MYSVFWDYICVVWQVDTSVSEEQSASAFMVLYEEGAATLSETSTPHTYTASRAERKFLNLIELKTCKMVMFQRKITPLNNNESFKHINF